VERQDHRQRRAAVDIDTAANRASMPKADFEMGDAARTRRPVFGERCCSAVTGALLPVSGRV
jgi:hypothetical protein